MTGMRILIEGEVKRVGYRAFITVLAEEYKFRRFNVENVKEGVQVLLDDKEESIQSFYNLLNSKEGRPPYAKISNVRPPEPYISNTPPLWEEFKRDNLPLFNTEQLNVMVQAGLKLRDDTTKGFKYVGKKIDNLGDKLVTAMAKTPRRKTSRHK